MIWQVRPTDVPAVTLEQARRSSQPKGVSGAHVWELDVDLASRSTTCVPGRRSALRDRPPDDEPGRLLRSRDAVARQLADQREQRGLQQEAEGRTRSTCRRRSSSSTPPASSRGRRSPSGRSPAAATSGSRWPRSSSRTCEKIGLNLSIQRADVSTWLAKFFPAGKRYPNTIIANYFSMPPNPTYALKQGQFGSCECNWKNTTFEALAAEGAGRRRPAGAAEGLRHDAADLQLVRAGDGDRAPDEHRRAPADASRTRGRTRRATSTSRRRGSRANVGQGAAARRPPPSRPDAKE